MTAVKKAAKKTAPAKTAAKKTAKAPRDRLPKADKAAAAEPVQYKTGDLLGEVEVPLSTGGEHDGRTKTLHPRCPSPDQIAWAEAAYYRMTLALRAFDEGEEFDQAERGRVFSEIRRLAAVFLSDWETDWAEDALAGGHVQLADIWNTMADMFTKVGGVPVNPDGEDADGTEITVGS